MASRQSKRTNLRSNNLPSISSEMANMNGAHNAMSPNFSRQAPSSQFSSKKSSIIGGNGTYVKNVGGSPLYNPSNDASPKMRSIMKEGGAFNQTFHIAAQNGMQMDSRNDAKEQSQSFYLTNSRPANSQMLRNQTDTRNMNGTMQASSSGMKDKQHLRRFQNLQINMKNIEPQRRDSGKIGSMLNDLNDNGEPDYLAIEDYDEDVDKRFVDSMLTQYLTDLFKDLQIRSSHETHVDKVTFIEYTKLPGIINDRLHALFQAEYDDNNREENEGSHSPLKVRDDSPVKSKENDNGFTSTSISPNKSQQKKPKVADYVTQDSFVRNFTKLLIGDLETKMRFTFKMYDFDNDKLICPEDIRIMMSYMPFQRNIQLQMAQMQIDKKGSTAASGSISPVKMRSKLKEGMYEDDEGKNLGYRDRISDQEEIMQFIDNIFNHQIVANHRASVSTRKVMSYDQYEQVNKTVSSEMFYSLMVILHEKLPCARNFYRLRQKFREKDARYQQTQMDNTSPIRTIASPKMIRGLSITKRDAENVKKGTIDNSSVSGSPDVRIKSKKNTQSIIKKLSALPMVDEVGLGDSGSNFSSELHLSNMNNRSAASSHPHSPHKLNKNSKFNRGKQEERKQMEFNIASIKMDKEIGDSRNSGQRQTESCMLVGDHSPNKKSQMLTKSGRNSNAFSLVSDDSPTKIDSGVLNINKIQPDRPLQGFGNYEKHTTKAEISLESYCLLKTKTDRYKQHWCVLAGNELYCYRQKEDFANQEPHRVMHSLVGTFIKELPPEESQSENCLLYPVKIVLPPNKSRLLYFKEEKQMKYWAEKMRYLTGQTDLFTFYQFESDLGKGQFGLVKLATHKLNGQKVAVKTINKKDMKPIEIYQQRREIEVLKMSQHPSIVALIDLFENSDFYYIVLEYMSGGDLFDYIQARNFKISEYRAKELAYQIGLALKYLHSYGIVHRDLKLENVMMSDTTEQSVPKLVDFGLAKMIGPNEKAHEPFGTLGYVAPEVLRKQPYSFSCDLWSYGCIIYALLSGSLPFDHESQRETINMTINKELEFDLPCWKNHSPICKDLLMKLLQKDPRIRITLDAALKHDWFKDLEMNESTGGLMNAKSKDKVLRSKGLVDLSSTPSECSDINQK